MKTSQPTTEDLQKGHIASLDFVRALAIMLVLIWHYFYCLVPYGTLTSGWGRMRYYTFWTWSGVDLFFVLSGFLIGRILIRNREADNYFVTFYLKRLYRIFPAYYVVLLFVLFLFLIPGVDRYPWLLGNAFPWYSYVFYIQNFWLAGTNDFGANGLSVTWSLAVEEQFYILLPVLVWFSHKKLPIILIAGILIAPIFRWWIFPGRGAYALLPARMDDLLLGVLIAWGYMNGYLDLWFKDRKVLVFGLALVGFFLVFLYHRFDKNTLGDPVLHSLLMLFYGGLLLSVLLFGREYVWMSHPVFKWIARISYMIYLSHQLVLGFLFETIFRHAPQATSISEVMVVLLSLVVTFVISTLSYYLLERRFLSVGDKLRYQHAAADVG